MSSCLTVVATIAVAAPVEGAMNVAGPAVPPVGFLEFCVRAPSECLPSSPASASPKAMLQNYWKTAFASAGMSRPMAPVQPSAIGAVAAAGASAMAPVVSEASATPLLTWSSRRSLSTEQALAPARLAQEEVFGADAGESYDVRDAGVQVASLDGSIGWTRLSTLAANRPASRARADVDADRAVGRPYASFWNATSVAVSRDLDASTAVRPDWNELFRAPVPSLTAPVEPEARPPVLEAPVAEAETPRRQAEGQVVSWDALRSLVTDTNRYVNGAIRQRDDIAIYGRADYWALPLAEGNPKREGDCEDYVLEKRHALIRAGVPAQALSIAIVETPYREIHAVLLVSTDRGEMVLDNLRPEVLPWRQVGYRWRQRQVAGAADMWVNVASDDHRRGWR
jgi:predicted transglutaminase-like cysteine proteinase